MPGFSGLSNHNCDRSRRDSKPCDFLISAIDFSRRLSGGGKIWRINGPARTTKSVLSIHKSEGCSATHVEWTIHAAASPVRSKSFDDAALQKIEAPDRIKNALTVWYSIT